MKTYFGEYEQEMIDDIRDFVVSKNKTPMYLSIPKWEIPNILSILQLEDTREISSYVLSVLGCFSNPAKWHCSENVEKSIRINWEYYFKNKKEGDKE